MTGTFTGIADTALAGAGAVLPAAGPDALRAAAFSRTAGDAAFRLSVVVPVFNERYVVEASLRRLLDVRSELISSLEVIVVDDASSDGSGEVLRRLAEADPRILLRGHEQFVLHPRRPLARCDGPLCRPRR